VEERRLHLFPPALLLWGDMSYDFVSADKNILQILLHDSRVYFKSDRSAPIVSVQPQKRGRPVSFFLPKNYPTLLGPIYQLVAGEHVVSIIELCSIKSKHGFSLSFSDIFNLCLLFRAVMSVIEETVDSEALVSHRRSIIIRNATVS
jgi:hypothetical protein